MQAIRRGDPMETIRVLEKTGKDGTLNLRIRIAGRALRERIFRLQTLGIQGLSKMRSTAR
jgi:hypothetical protein